MEAGICIKDENKTIQMYGLRISFRKGLKLGKTIIRAQPLTKDSSTGNVTEVDLSIAPAGRLPANGTVIISTEGQQIQKFM